MDKMIVTVLLMVAGVATTVMVINTAVPVINRSSSDLVTVADSMDDRIKSDIEIIEAIGELDSGGNWTESNGDGDEYLNR